MLPPCFAPILRRLTSTLPHHRRQRATLESVALTIPSSAASLTGSSAAAAYLAALVSALNRLVSTTDPAQLSNSRAQAMQATSLMSDGKLTKKQARKQRLEQSLKTQQVTDMSVLSLIAPKTAPAGTNEIAMEDSNQAQPVGLTTAADDNDVPETIGVVASFISLIALAIHGCSHAVVNLKADAILESVISAYVHTSGYVTVAHHVNIVIVAVLSVLAPTSWSSPRVQTAFIYLLRHSADSTDEAFRLNSRKALSALLHCPRGHLVASKTSNSAANFLVLQLKELVPAAVQDDLTDRQRGDVLEALLQCMSTIEQYVVFSTPSDAVLTATELLLIAVKDLPDISVHAYSALATVFSVRGVHALQDTSDVPLLPQSDLSKLVLAVLNHKFPEDSADEAIISYTTCVATGTAACVVRHEHFSPSDDLIYKPVQCLFQAMINSSAKSSIGQGVCRAFEFFLGNRWFMYKPAILTILNKLIDEKYMFLWSNAIPILRKYLENGMCAGHELMRNGVRSLVANLFRMSENGISQQDRKRMATADSLLKAVSRGGGASIILNHCPVTYDLKNHVTNGYVLAVLRDNVAGTSLASFAKYLIPVAQKLGEVQKQKAAEQRVVEAKNIGIYKMQIWALMPGFCTKPSDLLHEGVLTTAFKAIYMCFSANDSDNFLPVAIASLRQLALSISSLNAEDPMCKDKIEGFATRFKKLFPTLATAVSRCQDYKRAPLLDAVTVGCKATNDPKLVSTFLRKSIRQLLEVQLKVSDESQSMSDDSKEDIKKQQHSTTDLAIAITESNLVPQGSSEIGYLGKAMSPFFLDRKEGTMQKKAYRVSSMLITSDVVTQDHDKFMEFVKNTSDAFSMLAAGAKAARLGWITSIVNHHIKLPTESRGAYLEQLNSLFLSEILLSTRDSSEKNRAAAFEALVNVARGWHNLTPGNDNSSLQKFFLSLCAGLGGKSPTMLAGTLSSIGRMIETFRYEISSQDDLRKFVDSLFSAEVTDTEDGNDTMNDEDSKTQRCVEPGPIAILMRHECPEVQRAAVAIVKTATKCCVSPEGRLLKIVPGILPGLLHVAAGSNKRETRLRVRLVLERLIRKCGLENLQALFPEEHKKLLASVRKQLARDRNKKLALRTQRSGDDDGDGDNDEDDEGYLPEDADDSDDSDVEQELIEGDSAAGTEGTQSRGKAGQDVIDLLENKQGLTSSRARSQAKTPANRKPKKESKVSSEFKYSEDGKPIFVESDDGSGAAEAGSVDGNDDDDDDDGKAGKSEDGNRQAARKRRLDESDGAQRHAKKLKGSFGEEYRSKRSGGDVKRANRPDPYAYVPLGPSMFAAGSKPGAGGKRSRGTALHQLALSRSQVKKRAKSQGGRTGVPARR